MAVLPRRGGMGRVSLDMGAGGRRCSGCMGLRHVQAICHGRSLPRTGLDRQPTSRVGVGVGLTGRGKRGFVPLSTPPALKHGVVGLGGASRVSGGSEGGRPVARPESTSTPLSAQV